MHRISCVGLDRIIAGPLQLAQRDHPATNPRSGQQTG
jgi:hypothetical protein